MAWPLLAGIAGLALLDSLNPATIAAVALVLLLAQRRPVLSAVAVAAGAYLTVLGVGLVLFFSAGAAAEAVNGVVVALRLVAFGLAGFSLIVAGVRRLHDRPRKRVRLPDWFSPATAIGLGAGMTAADLPNAFPYFIAIERLLNANVSGLTGVAVIAGYAASTACRASFWSSSAPLPTTRYGAGCKGSWPDSPQASSSVRFPSPRDRWWLA